MNISNTPINQISKVKMNGVSQSASKPFNPSFDPDQVTISHMAKEVQSVKQFISGMPQTRMDKVGDLKKKIDDGLYTVSNDELASAIVSSAKHEAEGL
jgi:flagellar biosynthesis anti-sigma factor FlgM